MRDFRRARERGDPTIEVSFIVPCYGCRRTLGFTLRSILQQDTSRSSEVIVVDSSEERVGDWMRTHFPQVRVLHSEERLFAGAARNLGARESTGNWLAFVDADVTLSSRWLERLLDEAQAHPPWKALGAAIHNANPHSAASRVLYWIEFSQFLPGSGTGERDFLSTSNLLIRRDDFLRSGGFHREFQMAEDLLYFHRLSEPVGFVGSLSVGHHHRSRWNDVRTHLKSLGYWSGCLRRRYSLAGSWLQKAPALSCLLPWIRAMRIAGRVLRVDLREGLRAWLHFPLLLWGLFDWALAFRRGVSTPRPETESREAE